MFDDDEASEPREGKRNKKKKKKNKYRSSSEESEQVKVKFIVFFLSLHTEKFCVIFRKTSSYNLY